MRIETNTLDQAGVTELDSRELRGTDGGWIPVAITVIRLAANPYVRAAVVGAVVGVATALMEE